MRLVSLLLAAAVPLAGACGNAPSQDQCEALMDHLIDLELAKTGAKTVTTEMKPDTDKQKKAVSDYLHDKFLEGCTKKTPKTAIECGIGAKNDAELARCDEPEK